MIIKKLARLLIVLSSFWYAVLTAAFPVVVAAQESLTTGDATASATASSEANEAETEVAASEPIEVEVDTTQEAETETDSSAESSSGDVEAVTSGELEVETGEASSDSTASSLDNLNVVETGGEVATLSAETDQEAEAIVESEAQSESGEVKAVADWLELITGDGISLSNLINIENINLVGSELIWLIQTIIDGEGEINFYELFSQEATSQLPQDTEVVTNQEGKIQSNNSADTTTGGNEAVADEMEVTTGDATSVANTVNLANLNLVGNRSLFTIINILGNYQGDIVLPNGSHLGYEGLGWENLNLVTNQEAQTDTSSLAQSTTGDNQLEGDFDSSTGDATSLANTRSYVNLVRIGDNWAFLLVNLFGGWSGSLVNWSAPGEASQLGWGSHLLEQTWNSNEPSPGQGNLTVETNQKAVVESTTQANTQTGGNNLLGTGEVTTGDATSVANDFTLANFVGIGGSFLFGVFNILGNWVGDLVVAYPDLAIGVTDNLEENAVGNPQNYLITVQNNGRAEAKDVKIDFDFEGDFIPSQPVGGWLVESLAPGEIKEFEVNGNTSPTALSGSVIKAQASVTTPETEETLANNSASDETIVVLPVVMETESEPDHREPDLRVRVWNNVNDFVYPGDTVRASITVANQSQFISHATQVHGQLANDHPMPAIPMNWELGDLKPGERVKIEFEIQLIEELPEGEYHLSVYATGKSAAGDESSSESVVSNFLVRLKALAGLVSGEALAQANNSTSGQVGEVLGISDQKGFDIRDYFSYIFVASILMLLALAIIKKKVTEGVVGDD